MVAEIKVMCLLYWSSIFQVYNKEDGNAEREYRRPANHRSGTNPFYVLPPNKSSYYGELD